MKKERDYVLGTNDEEIERLGLQHRIWRAAVLDCWHRAGLTVGRKVIDIGAGPGYATIDLAEIVGPTGQVTAVERSAHFVQAIKETCRGRGLSNVRVHEMDLMTDELPGTDHDFSWCRWVLCFVSDPARLIKKIAGALRPGGRAIFYEYGHYRTWRHSPRLPIQEEFVERVMESWRETGGEADAGMEILPMVVEQGMTIQSIKPHVYCVRPNDYMWQWPAAFIQSAPERLQELGKVDQAFVDQLQAAFALAEANPASVITTPLVLEIVAQKGSTA